MSEPFASGQPRRPPPVPMGLGRLLEPLYGAAIGRRNRRFDRGRGVTRLPVPVVSVGNLSVGGTGKTPLVMALVSLLLRNGRRPCVAMRGYSKGQRPGAGRAAPDETDAYRRAFPGLAIVAQPDRALGLRRLLEAQPGAFDCVVLDDGFQHRRIARDLDLVLVDASRPVAGDRLLPAGWLREPATSLARASAVVLTHAELVPPADVGRQVADLGRLAGGKLVAVARHLWTGLRTGDDDAERALPLNWLLGKRVVGACAIGNPAGFLHSLRSTLAADPGRVGTLVDALVLPDHDPFDPAVVRTLIRMAENAGEAAAVGNGPRAVVDAIVVTDKDWSKLRRVRADAWPCPVVRPELAVSVDTGREELERLVLRAAGGAGAPPA